MLNRLRALVRQPMLPRSSGFGFWSLLQHPVAQNALALYGVQLAGYILPLVTLPYLARVLGPEEFGRIVFVQSYAVALSVLIEFGFGLSAAREVSRRREDRGQVARVVAGVIGAKVFLAILVGILVAALAWSVPAFRPYRDYMVWAFLMTLAMGMSPFWFFQGIERMRWPAVVDLAARCLATAGLFFLIQGPGDSWKVLAIYGTAGLFASGIPHLWIFRAAGFSLPKLSEVRNAVRMSWLFFVTRLAVTGYTTANGFILGLLAAPLQVAFFGGAERISRGVMSLLDPISHALYPRMSYLVAHDRGRARRLMVSSLVSITGVGLVLGCAVVLGAPILVHWLLGPGFEGAVSPLRVLSALLPVTAFNVVLGMQWMLPLGMERAYTWANVMAGVLNIVLAVALVPWLGGIGMAWAVVTTEGVKGAFMFWRVRHAPAVPRKKG